MENGTGEGGSGKRGEEVYGKRGKWLHVCD